MSCRRTVPWALAGPTVVTWLVAKFVTVEAVLAVVHETGHALYEQGLPAEYYGLPLGEYASLSIHESQSRLWENHIGRSFSWWQTVYPRQLPDLLADAAALASGRTPGPLLPIR